MTTPTVERSRSSRLTSSTHLDRGSGLPLEPPTSDTSLSYALPRNCQRWQRYENGSVAVRQGLGLDVERFRGLSTTTKRDRPGKRNDRSTLGLCLGSEEERCNRLSSCVVRSSFTIVHGTEQQHGCPKEIGGHTKFERAATPRSCADTPMASEDDVGSDELLPAARRYRRVKIGVMHEEVVAQVRHDRRELLLKVIGRRGK